LSWSHRDPVAIVGGGIAGLALARALHVRDIPVVVFERRSSFSDGGLAVNLPGNAIRALGQLGLGDEIEAVGHPLRRREYRNASDRLLFAIDETAFWGSGMWPRSVRRSTLIDMLRTGLPRSVIQSEREVASLDLWDPVRLNLSDGTSYEAAVVVGADGIKSVVRNSAFGLEAASGHSRLSDASWRFMVPNCGIDCWTAWIDRRGTVLLMPVGDEVYGWAAVTDRQSGPAPIDALIQLVSGFPDRVQSAVIDAIASRGGVYHSPIEEVRLRHWTGDLVALIGDAAHATAPVWAEGVGMGLEDALVLAEALASKRPLHDALKRFEDHRRPRVDHVQAMTDIMSQAAKLPNLLRDLLMPILGPKSYRRTYGPLKGPA
jgi:2-polyprenyl-6-methoxyphenol hydroxylase-like FAD-dependent oxidoreductase